VSSVHVSGHRADRAAPLSQPDTMRLRIDFRAKLDSIRPKTNPGGKYIPSLVNWREAEFNDETIGHIFE
jgi:hypothetical protein